MACGAQYLVGEEVPQVFGLVAQLIDGLETVHMARRLDGDDASVRCEHLEHDGTVVLVFVVLVERELGELLQRHRGACHRALLVLGHVRYDVEHVVDHTLGRHHRVVEGLEGERAAAEGQAPEWQCRTLPALTPVAAAAAHALVLPLALQQIHLVLRVLFLAPASPHLYSQTAPSSAGCRRGGEGEECSILGSSAKKRKDQKHVRASPEPPWLGRARCWWHWRQACF